jgi:hypothetical protein
LLSVAAVVSLSLGLFQDFGTTCPPGEPPVVWVEGVAILTAILIVVGVGSLDDWQKERQFQVLNVKKEDCHVKVICDGGERQIDVHQVVVHCSSLAKLFLAMVSSFLVTTYGATSPLQQESQMRSRSSPMRNASCSETNGSWALTLMISPMTVIVSAPLEGK